MSNQSPSVGRGLPANPNLRHLKDQAKDLLKTGVVKTLTEAQFRIARMYGFANWPKLKARVESLRGAGQLKEAIDQNDFARVQTLMLQNPALHRAPLGYGEDGPLTWVAECRVPRVPPGEARLAMARWMIEHGSDVHQGSDGPLMRAALDGERIPMMDLLVSCGADVNAAWHGFFPILYAACEALDPDSLRWLLAHGADPNCGSDELWKRRGRPHPGTALDYLLEAYVREPAVLSECIDILLGAGARSKHDSPAVLAVLRGRLSDLRELLDEDPALPEKRFPGLDFGTTAGRRLTLRGATLLHVAAEFEQIEAVRLLLDQGADVNARATVEAGVGGQTAIFHAASQWDDRGLPIVQLLCARGADLGVRATIRGDYERPGDVVTCTPLGYALRFPGGQARTLEFLQEQGGTE
jgi:ankyrin repeat protein